MSKSMGKRVKTPTVLQMEAVECGAASLAMVLGYYGRIETLAKLRQNCGVSRDGSKAANILRAARRYGMEANGIKADVPALKSLQMPCILFWEFNHFVVLEGFKKDVAYINDPAMGHRVIPIADFERSFTGVALAMKPGEEFERGGKKPSLFGAVSGAPDRFSTSHRVLHLSRLLNGHPGNLVSRADANLPRRNYIRKQIKLGSSHHDRDALCHSAEFRSEVSTDEFTPKTPTQI